MRTTSHIRTSNGINWYYEQEGSGPDIVLIPDGIGDCQLFDRAIPIIAAAGFRVTTFDMPGMSRSSDAPVETYTNVTAQDLASYVINLLDALDIPFATFWGCSSAGSTVLVLCKDYPEYVRNAMAHEIPDEIVERLDILPDKDDRTINQIYGPHFLLMVANDEKAWRDLGEDCHARLRKNVPRWARGYVRTLPLSSPTGQLDLKEVMRKPLMWSVGATMPMEMFYRNVVAATKAGIEMKVLPGGHMLYTSHPGDFAKHVVETTKKYV